MCNEVENKLKHTHTRTCSTHACTREQRRVRIYLYTSKIHAHNKYAHAVNDAAAWELQKPKKKIFLHIDRQRFICMPFMVANCTRTYKLEYTRIFICIYIEVRGSIRRCYDGTSPYLFKMRVLWHRAQATAIQEES